ncbi:MAG: ISNCY family transposase [Candidatus Cloacimonetes bacterium]|nr:ISNCY family transposase [Candidatus Cloacimonadota bacterium]
MELTALRPNEQMKYSTAKEVIDLGCTDTAIRRGRTKLGCTRKTLLKYIQWHESGNVSLFSHHNKERKPATTKSEETRNLVKQLYKDKYSNASFTHFAEILKEDYNMSISDGTLHAILKEALFVSPCSKKATKRIIEKKVRLIARKEHLSKAESEQVNAAFCMLDAAEAHPRRPRSKYFGEMVQMDASELIWVPNAKKWHLHIAVDDATSEVVGAWFDTQETLNGYYNVLYMILKNHGIPSLFRTDRRTVFEYSLLSKPDEEKDTFTQFAAACKTLGIGIETSSIPQFKARVERMNKTLQGRIPVELARHKITTIEEANAFLWDYLPRFNAQFSLKDEKDLLTNTFLEAPPETDINVILAVVSKRVIDAGHSIQYHNSYYLPCARYSNGLRPKYFIKGTKALVIKAFDGTLLANIKEDIYILNEIEKRSAHSKEFDPGPTPAHKSKKQFKPAEDHPWRTSFLTSKVLETHIAKPREDYQS